MLAYTLLVETISWNETYLKSLPPALASARPSPLITISQIAAL